MAHLNPNFALDFDGEP